MPLKYFGVLLLCSTWGSSHAHNMRLYIKTSFTQLHCIVGIVISTCRTWETRISSHFGLDVDLLFHGVPLDKGLIHNSSSRDGQRYVHK